MFSISLPGAVDELARQEPMIGVFLLGIGLLFILMGLRLSRMLVGLSYGVIGFVVGASLPSPGIEARIGLGLGIALVLALSSLWVPRPSIAVLSGLWAAVGGMLLAVSLGMDTLGIFSLGAVLFAAGASLAFVLSQEMVALITSLEGTILFVGGLIVVANQCPALASHLRNLIVTNSIFGPFLLLAGTVIGFYTQIAELQKKQTGRSA